jgi:hypothetical protein
MKKRVPKGTNGNSRRKIKPIGPSLRSKKPELRSSGRERKMGSLRADISSRRTTRINSDLHNKIRNLERERTRLWEEVESGKLGEEETRKRLDRMDTIGERVRRYSEKIASQNLE